MCASSDKGNVTAPSDGHAILPGVTAPTDPRRERAERYIHDVWPRIANLGDPFREAKTLGFGLAHDVLELLGELEQSAQRANQLQMMYLSAISGDKPSGVSAYSQHAVLVETDPGRQRPPSG